MSSFGKFSLVPAAAVMAMVAVPGAQAEMTANIGGRLHLDLAEYSSDVTELGSGSEIRRAYLNVDGQLVEGWDYKVQVDFADGDVEVKDAYLKNNWLTIGQFKVPQALEAMTSDNYITFIERSQVVDAFAVDRRIGAGAGFSGDNWTGDVAVFGQNARVQDGGKDEGMGVSGRFTYLPWKTDNGFLHLGVWGSFEEPQNTVEEVVRYRARPESHVTSVRLIDTSTIDNVNDIMKLGLEGAWVMDSIAVQGEYIQTDVNRKTTDVLDPKVDVDFDGYYVQASYLTGGNSRAYKGGAFGRTKASDAWEFAIRYSTLDLAEQAGVIGGRGGEQTIITLGVNYYVSPNLRFMANYADVETKNYNDGSPEESPSVLQFRVSYDFK
ncbi:MAG: OprO/OprP family phosphate-selective porin [Chromatiales bacterium]|nr:OprO/OprP family phosphate-selective porin [Chromatiales bacterium]